MSKSYPISNTLIEFFYHWEETTPEVIFLRQPKGYTWKTISFREAGQEVRKMATALKALGLNKGDHIAIYSKNCYHWILADLAIMMGGYVSVPLYASLPKEKLQEIIIKSNAKAIFLGKLDDWGDRNEALPNYIKAIRFPHYSGNAQVDIGLQWNDLVENHQAQLENYKPDPDNLWTILFTSGTTGSPKGVMHQHRTPTLIMHNELKTGWLGIHNPTEQRYFSYLPLNHVAERIGMETPALGTSGTISFAENLETFAQNLQDTLPTTFFAVPRIWTKFYIEVINKMPQRQLDWLFKIPLVSWFVKRRILKALGLSKVNLAATGAAVTPAHIKNWYGKLGIHLVEAYGMTEVCGSITNSPMKNCPSDSVGKAKPGAEIRIHPDTGEILMKTPYMMTGYYNDTEKTAEVLKYGWMHSGDKGTKDEHGFVRVIGRVKASFKTSKGSYVTPNPIEEILAKNEFVEQVCVVGLGIPQPLAILNLSERALSENQEKVEESLLTTVGALNAKHSNYEKISTVIINKEPWSQENDLLTPTLKVKRGSIDARFGKDFLSWHESSNQIIWY